MGANGEPVLTSEVYTDKRQVIDTLHLVRRTVSLESFSNNPEEVDERAND